MRSLKRSSSTSGSASSEAPLSDRKITACSSSSPRLLERGEDPAHALVHAGRSAPRRPPCAAPATPCTSASFHAGCVGSRVAKRRGVVEDAGLAQPLRSGARAAHPSPRRRRRGSSRRPLRARAAASAAPCTRRRGRTAVAGARARDSRMNARRFVGDRVGVVEIGVERLVLDVLLAARQRARLEERAAARQRAEEAVEAAARRPRVVRRAHLGGEVPLAGQARRVARGLEHLGERDAAVVDRAGVTARPVVVGQDADAGLVRMQPGQERRAGRAAARGVVELREAGRPRARGDRYSACRSRRRSSRCPRIPCRRRGRTPRSAAP